MTGITAGESNSITIPTFHIAGPSSIAMVLIRDARTLIIPVFLVGTALAGMTVFAATRPAECIPAPSAGSIMAEWRELILSVDSPALAASMEAVSAVEVSMVGRDSTAAGATDKSHEVINNETRNDQHD